ncbi:Thiol-disulfide isomerase or thioredoxin [Rhodovulum sp. ES.010]|uniref:TlpA family protein disulfide reductase n=1 Tax=Rhodovulum sp. ES.010 TaxID=1882821 RepID=UPI000928D292|nr:TlpA disulfide reductase family protein [Rhodovulum sp. ES.010]SIO46471.1 Thiol-disulfide isomerase or thioredoxin [Rhodovulum sp. ES.010]
MSLIRSLVLYTALALGANAALAGTAALEALREGGMKKLNFHAAARPVPEAVLIDATGAERDLSDYRGQWVVLNFWATWCAPCRHELPALDRLQAELGGDSFAVVTVATGRNSPQGIDRLFSELEIRHLPKWQDKDSALARQMAVMGLPVTVILDPEGREIARMQGDAEWDSDSAKAIVAALLDGT